MYVGDIRFFHDRGGGGGGGESLTVYSNINYKACNHLKDNTVCTSSKPGGVLKAISLVSFDAFSYH